jgi:hypothetical protein
MGQGLGVGAFVDCHVLDRLVVPGRSQHVAANPTEPVYAYADSHENLLCFDAITAIIKM